MDDTQQLIEQLSQQVAAMKAVPPRTYVLRLLGVLFVYGCLMQGMLGFRPDLMMHLVRPMFSLELVLLAGLLSSSAIACVFAMYPDAYQKRYLLRLPYGFAVAMFAVILCQLFLPVDSRMVMPTATSHTVECTMFIAAASLLPTMLIFILLRRGATLVPLEAGALAVMTASAVSALTLRLAEANDYIVHLLVWHYGPSIGFAIVGALLGRFILKW